MTRPIAIALGLALLTASTADAGTFKPDHGSFGSYTKPPSMAGPPRPPAPPASPGYRPAGNEGAFKPWKPSMRTDSTRGGVNAYPEAKKPRGYISPY